MIRKPGLFLIAAVCCIFMVGLTMGMTGGNSASASYGSNSPELSDQYVLPVGGFDAPYTYASPNSSLNLTYIFYSRNWGSGNVTYTLTATDYYGLAPEDCVKISFQSSTFTAKPDSEYVTQVHVVTGPAFNLNGSICDPNGCVISPVNIHMNVTFEDNATHLCDDTFPIYSWHEVIPGLPAVHSDYFQVKNDTVFGLASGETRMLMMEFYRGGGISNISYAISDTPLNVTITPSSFIARKGVGAYPANMTVHAGPGVPPGNYTFTLNIPGAQGIDTYSRDFFINVSSGPGPITNTTIYFFYGDGCAHCDHVMPLVTNLTKKYPDADIQILEVWHNQTNEQIWNAANAAAGVSYYGVPEVIYGTTALIGDKEIPEKFESLIQGSLKKS